MRRNGEKRGRKARLVFELALELRLVEHARHTPVKARAEALAWLRRWRRKPRRVFWEVRPTGGLRML